MHRSCEMEQRKVHSRSREGIPEVIVLEMRYQFMKNYNYLVVDAGTGKAIIVDPAWEIGKIDRAVTEAQAGMSGILITHSHPDHIDLAKSLATKYSCPIWMSNEEIRTSGFDARHLVGIDASPWPVGGMLIEPIFTPGHTPGCMCYLIGNSLFSGDVLFAEGCGICPDVEAAYAMFASLEHLKARLDPETRIFPGHSYGKPPGQSLSQLLRNNIYLQFSNREAFAAFRLRKGQNVAKMFHFS